MSERAFRLDLAIALFAVLISSVAAGASVYQTFVIREQLSATIWPYLDFSGTNDPNYYDLELVNDGLGPAIVQSAVFLLDGKPYADFGAILQSERVRLRATNEPKKPTRVVYNDISRGDVVPPGKERQLLRIERPGILAQIAPLRKRVDIRICYCSLLRQCWLLDFQAESGQPSPVANCT